MSHNEGVDSIRRLSVREQSMNKGFATLSAASIAVKLLSLLFVPIIVKVLGGNDKYSVYYSANQVFAFVYVIATAGIPVGISKIVTEMVSLGNRAQAKKSFYMARMLMFGIGIIGTLVLIIFSHPIARLMNNEDCYMGIVVLAPTVFLCSILSAYRGYMQGMKNMTPTAVSQVVEQIVHVVFSIIMVLLLRSKGIVWAVAGASAGTVMGSLVALIIVIKYYRQYETEDKIRAKQEAEKKKEEGLFNRRREGSMTTSSLMKKLIYYSIPITISSAIQYGGNMIDTSIMIDRLEKAGFSTVAARSLHGNMGAARQLLNVPTALITALCISLLPVIAGLYAQGKTAESQEKSNYSFKLCYIVAVPASVLMCIFAEPIYTILGFGSDYRILSYMSFSILLLGIVHLQSSIMQSVNRLFSSTLYMAIGVLSKIILNYVLIAIPALNIYGAIIATYVSYMIPMVLNQRVLSKNNIKIKIFDLTLLPFISSGIMIICSLPVYMLLNKILFNIISVYISTAVSLLAAGIIAIVVYFISMRGTKGILKDDIYSISPRLADKFFKENAK